MATKRVLCLAALLAFSAATVCPKYTCDATIASNICASYSQGNDFKLNSNGCQSGSYCSSIGTSAWAIGINNAGSTSGAATTYPCTAESTSSTTTSGSWDSMSCGTKLPNKNFKSGQTVISCINKNECVLSDDTTTDCVCVFKTDGTGICEANTNNDQVFTGYWNDCGTSNTLTDWDTAAYWIYYMMYWEFTQSNVACMSIFMETTMLSDLYDAYNGAATLVAGLLVLY